MVSFDGLGAELARRFVDEGTAPTLAALERAGLFARLRPVEPTVTAVNHVALVTGRLPEDTGIVGNLFRPAGSAVTVSLSGFSAPIAVETVWQAAHRGGLGVGVLLWPGCDGASAERRADFGLTWPVEPLAPSAILELGAGRATATELPSEDGVAGESGACRWRSVASSPLAASGGWPRWTAPPTARPATTPWR